MHGRLLLLATLMLAACGSNDGSTPHAKALDEPSTLPMAPSEDRVPDELRPPR